MLPDCSAALDFVDANLASSQGTGIELHAHRILLRSVDLHLGHAVHHGNALRDGGFRSFINVRQLGSGELSAR